MPWKGETRGCAEIGRDLRGFKGAARHREQRNPPLHGTAAYGDERHRAVRDDRKSRLGEIPKEEWSAWRGKGRGFAALPRADLSPHALRTWSGNPDRESFRKEE